MNYFIHEADILNWSISASGKLGDLCTLIEYIKISRISIHEHSSRRNEVYQLSSKL